jgi:hypothetical protein
LPINIGSISKEKKNIIATGSRNIKQTTYRNKPNLNLKICTFNKIADSNIKFFSPKLDKKPENFDIVNYKANSKEEIDNKTERVLSANSSKFPKNLKKRSFKRNFNFYKRLQ